MKQVGSNFLVFIITTIGVFVSMGLINPSFILFFVIHFAVMVVIEIFFDRRIMVINDKFNKANENASGTIVENSSNILAIKAMGAQKTVAKKMRTNEDLSKQFAFHKIRLSNIKWICFQIWGSVTWGVFLLLLGYEVVWGKITVGMILISLSYYLNFKDRTVDFIENMNELVDMKSDISRMMPIFWSGHTLKTGKESFPVRWNKIQLNNISFSYQEDSVALHNINLRVSKNEKIGIAGHSGSGKSTLAKLFLGLYQINEGSFTIGTQNYYSIKHEEVINNITVVLQESELFNVSLKENITMMKDVNEKLFQMALQMAQLEDIIKRLPRGLDTLIGEKGYALSGGERQRVGIARAICRNAPIMILDEATSALDSNTEKKIMDALLGPYGERKTMLIIAHRISTLQNTDKIIVFEKGNIVEEGTFSSLTKQQNSLFKEMYEMQSIAG
jgi:ABC-type multidrug transport system fused ATPase/permease subunit